MAKRISAVSLGLAAAAALAIVLGSVAGGAAADDCLAAPNQAPADGRHWFFRTDRASGKKCWYLRDGEAATTGSVASQAQSAAPPDRPAAVGLDKNQQDALFENFLRWRKQHGETQ